jgi:excisionase family DNA binding protein
MDKIGSHGGDGDCRATARDQLAKLLLTPEEAAVMLSVGRTRVYELIGSGQLAAVRIGASRRIPLQELQRFVDQLLAAEAATNRD